MSVQRTDNNLGLNYKYLPKQKLFHQLTSLKFQEFTQYLTRMDEERLKEYINLVETLPYYLAFGGARG